MESKRLEKTVPQPVPDPLHCHHGEFGVLPEVYRMNEAGEILTDLEIRPDHYLLGVRVRCKLCGRIFAFHGLQKGVSFDSAGTGPESLIAFLPIWPAGSKKIKKKRKGVKIIRGKGKRR